MEGDEVVDSESVVFDEKAISILQAVFNCTGEPTTGECLSKTASVKFMITIQDEKDLRNLGYSQSQIDTIKPQEAEYILKANKV